jgi:hypothetical protein
MGHVPYMADFGHQGRRCPLSRGLGGFTLSSRHGGQVAWKQYLTQRGPIEAQLWHVSAMRSSPRAMTARRRSFCIPSRRGSARSPNDYQAGIRKAVTVCALAVVVLFMHQVTDTTLLNAGPEPI